LAPVSELQINLEEHRRPVDSIVFVDIGDVLSLLMEVKVIFLVDYFNRLVGDVSLIDFPVNVG